MPPRLLAPGSPPARLRLVPTANVRFAIRPAVRCALGLIFLRQRLVTRLVMVIGHLASQRGLFITRVLLRLHVDFL